MSALGRWFDGLFGKDPAPVNAPPPCPIPSSFLMRDWLGLCKRYVDLVAAGTDTQQAVFDSGHLDLTNEEFLAHYVPLLGEHAAMGHSFVVGDASGCDFAVQRWLKEHNKVRAERGLAPVDVRVFHMLEAPRFVYGGRKHFTLVGGFVSDEERDAAMTEASDADVAWVRPGGKKRNSGTAKNVARRHVQAHARQAAERELWPKGYIDDCTDDGGLSLRMPDPTDVNGNSGLSDWQREHLVPIPPGFAERYRAACREYHACRDELFRIRAEAEHLALGLPLR